MDFMAAVRLGGGVLQDWKPIGRGGFGAVSSAMQTVWHFRVAIKTLHTTDTTLQLLAEAEAMRRCSCCPSVLRVFGVFEGPAPGAPGQRVGLVMEYMRRGSLEALLEALRGPPPWPLAFRLAAQLALGMNFLHSLDPPLLHRDLKPSNVLLDEDLNAKLADFGLSRVSSSALASRERSPGDRAGTLPFTPPEAFQLSYQPVRSFDLYSYGILLWCLLTGDKPYSGVEVSSLVELLVDKGQRPPRLQVGLSQVEGLAELDRLMERCWDGDPARRPSFRGCLQVTEEVLSRYKQPLIRRSVDEVLSRMDSEPQLQGSGQRPGPSAEDPPAAPAGSSTRGRPAGTENSRPEGLVYGYKPTEPLTVTEKAAFVDRHRASLIQQVSAVAAITEDLRTLVHPETVSRIQAEKTNQDKLRLLYSLGLHSGGPLVKALFYDRLATHEPDLVERMGRGTAPLP